METKVSTHRAELGSGAIEGVAGPEAANNAAAGGGMIPLLSLGLPFTPSTAVLLSGMLLVLNLPLVGVFARVATIPPRFLMPAVLVLCAVAAYSDNNNLFDVWVMVVAGIAGWAMRALNFSPAPLVLGLVLGPVLERRRLVPHTGSGRHRERRHT